MITPPEGETRQTSWRIAVLVQGDPFQDARVRKEVASLGRAGHLVDIVGPLSAGSRRNDPIPGAHAMVATDMVSRSLAGRLYRLADRLWPLVPRLVPAAILLGFAGLAGGSGFRLSGPALAAALAFFAGLAGWLVLRRLDLRQRLYDSLIRLRGRRTAARRSVHYQTLADQIVRAVRPDAYDALHCHDLIPLMAGTALKRRHPALRLIWDAHEFYEDTASGTESDRLLAQRVIAEASGLVDGFITISDSFRDLYASHYPGLPAAKVVMNATLAAPPVRYDGRLHQAAGLAPARQILLFQGAFHPARGIDALLEAARHLPEPWSVVMMGDGPLGDQIRAAARSMEKTAAPGQAPLVWLPPVPNPDLRLWSAGASLGAIPYEEKGLNHLFCTPNKLWEFPDAGVPVLATDLTGMGRIIRDYGTGFLLPRRFTPVDISEALRRITAGDMTKAIANCRAFSESMSWSRFEPELLKVYSP